MGRICNKLEKIKGYGSKILELKMDSRSRHKLASILVISNRFNLGLQAAFS